MLQFRDMEQFRSTVDSIIEENSSIIQLKDDVREIRVTFDQMQTTMQQMADGINYLLKRTDETDYHSSRKLNYSFNTGDYLFNFLIR